VLIEGQRGVGGGGIVVFSLTKGWLQ